MKRFMIASVAVAFISLPLFANTPDSSATSTTTETMKTTYPESESTSDMQKMEEHKKVEGVKSHTDRGAQLQQEPSTIQPKRSTETMTTEEITD